MSKDREFYTEYPENPPDWYWKAGLHDACIVGAEVYEFPFDYNKYAREKNKVWWLADRLTENSGKYELDALLEICVPYQKQFHLKLRFERAEVYRK